jgi:peptidoglycan/xylan/chitin deacetylase (PgdA/CDA1 family)
MRMRRQDLCILMLYYLGYTRIRNAVLRWQRKPVTTFVTFHDIPPALEEDFRRKILCLRNTTNVVSLDDFFAGRLSAGRTNVVITFDDGYQSWISTALPLLQELHMPATFFVTSGFLDLSPPEEARFIRSRLQTHGDTTGALKSDDLRKIVEQGFAVGGHTVNHVNLAAMRDEAEIRHEIMLDKQNLESIICARIKYFAYPFGEFHNPDIDLAGLLKTAGYDGAVTLVPGFNRNDSNRYCLMRELTGAPMPPWAFKARVFGAYDGINYMRKLLGLKCYPAQSGVAATEGFYAEG